MELSDEDLAAAILEAVSTPMGEGFLGAPSYSSEDIAEAKAAVAKHRTIRQQQRAQRLQPAAWRRASGVRLGRRSAPPLQQRLVLVSELP